MPRSCRTLAVVLPLTAVLLGLEQPNNASQAAPPPAVATEEQAFLQRLGVGTEPAALLQLLNNHSRTEKDAAALDRLVRQLGDEEFEVRDKASRAIIVLGPPALERLAEAARDRDLEIRTRAARCIEEIEKKLNKDAAYCAVSEVIRQRVPGAARALFAYLPYADWGAEEAIYFGLENVAVQDGKIDPAVRTALTDKVPARRALAALFLGRRGDDADRAAVRQALADKEPVVRLRAAQGLLAAHDDAALSALAGLLDTAPLELAWQAEELLRWAAGPTAPSAVLGAADAKQQRACRTAWDKWIKDNAHLDWQRVARDHRRPGLFLVLTPSHLYVMGSSGKPTWQVALDDAVTDAHLLPNGHLLLAEQDNSRIHERTINGKTIWEFHAPGTEDFMGCQRLPNGNTFMISDENLMEVTPSGAQVFLKDTSEDDLSTDAVRSRLGRIYYLNGPNLIELNGAGAKVRKIKVDGLARNMSANTKLEALPDGGVLLNLMSKNKVQRRGRDGAVVWEATVQRPGAACMLPNGNVVVDSFQPRAQRMMEITPDGKTVWEAKATSGKATRLRTCFNLLRVGLDYPRPTDFDIDGVAFRTEGLKDPDVATRRRSAGALAEMGPKAVSAISALATALADTDAEVRRSSGTALAKIGAPALPALMTAVKAGVMPAADEAAVALSQMKDTAKEKLPELIALMASAEQSVSSRAAAAKALGEIGVGSEQAVKELLTTFRAGDLQLRCAAGRSLGLIAARPEEVIPALTAALKDPADSIKSEAIHALARFGSKAEPAVPALVEVLQGKDAGFRILSADALGSIGTQAKAAMPALTRLLKDRAASSDLRAASAQAIVRMGPAAKDAFPAFLEVFKDANLPAELTRSLPDMVCSTLKKEGTPLLVQVLKEGTKPARTAVLASLTRSAPLGRIPGGPRGGPQAPRELLDAVKEIADKDADATLRRTARTALIRLQQGGFGR